MANTGKVFEADFRASLPPRVLVVRLNDSPQAFSKSKLTRFTRRTPCDFILFDGKTLYPVELKTTKYRSISFENINDDDDQNKMVHKHQILGLTEFSKYENVKAGFFFDFRDEENDCERCYFQRIEDFNNMIKQINKKSFNELDLLTVGKAIKIKGEKKRTRYRWNFDKFFETQQ
jgi:hypothetical protein